MTATRRVRLCVVGAQGRMGSTIIREASQDRFEVSGAIESRGHPKIGKSLEELGLGNGSVRIQEPSSLPRILGESDVCISFTKPEAELENIPVIVRSGKPVVMGTTGFTPAQRETIDRAVVGKIPAVITSNFSVGANMLFGLAASLRSLPKEYDVSIMETHHSGKVDAPSGTALQLGEIISKARGYTQKVYGRSGLSKRKSGELEIASLRGGGVPGDHVVFAFGPYETLKIEHSVSSRSTFAQGALLAAEWILGAREKRVYSMMDVLGF